MLEIDRRRSVAELVNRNPESDRFLDAHSNLLAKHDSRFRISVFAGEQAVGIRSTKQRRPELVNVFIDEVRQGLIEFEVQIDTVLDIIMRENEPIGRVEPARLDQVLA